MNPTTGKEGLRVRQSLKTDNEHEAATLRDQMNALLASPQLWDLGAREQALGLFDPRIVDIFFYLLEGGETDFLALRDGLLGPAEASALVDAMETQVRGTWYATARAAGVSERDCERIATAFAYPGFRQRQEAK